MSKSKWSLVIILLVVLPLGGCFKHVQPKELNWYIMNTPEKRNCIPVKEKEKQWCINNKSKVKNEVCKKARINYVRCVVKDQWIIRMENNWPFPG